MSQESKPGQIVPQSGVYTITMATILTASARPPFRRHSARIWGGIWEAVECRREVRIVDSGQKRPEKGMIAVG
jgi:hypothetical protein